MRFSVFRSLGYSRNRRKFFSLMCVKEENQAATSFRLSEKGKARASPLRLFQLFVALLQKCFQEWSGKTNSEERKKIVLELLNAHVKVIKTDDLILATGLVAPLAAMGLKKSSQNVPQLKRIRLDLVPDIIFVPTFAVATLFFVKIVQLKKGRINE